MSETVLGNLFIVPGSLAQSHADNGLAITMSGTSVSGSMEINIGNGGPNAFESLSLSNITSSDLIILVNSNAGDSVNIDLTDVAASDPSGGLLMWDVGHGIDSVNMLNDATASHLVVILSDSGANDRRHQVPSGANDRRHQISPASNRKRSGEMLIAPR